MHDLKHRMMVSKFEMLLTLERILLKMKNQNIDDSETCASTESKKTLQKKDTSLESTSFITDPV